MWQPPFRFVGSSVDFEKLRRRNSDVIHISAGGKEKWANGLMAFSNTS